MTVGPSSGRRPMDRRVRPAVRGWGRCSVRSPCRAPGAPPASPIRPRCRSTTSLIGSTRTMSTSVSFAPSLSHAIVRVADGRPRLPSVSLFRSNSEAAHWSLVAPLRRLVGPHLTIRAGYAASEVGAIAHFDIGPDDPIGEGRIPLGRLEPGVEVRLEPLEDDPSTTQLLVARPRAFGYLGDPELTASRYLTDEDGTRWWRSGDVVRVDDVGTYHHLGRADEMVKVKGTFVAPSRVEAGAAKHRRNRRCRGDTAPRRERLGPLRRPRAGRRRHTHARARRCPTAGTTATRARARHPDASRRAAANPAHETRPPGPRERAARAVAVDARSQVHFRVRVVVSRRSAPHHRVRRRGARRRPLRSRTGLPRCARVGRVARRCRLRRLRSAAAPRGAHRRRHRADARADARPQSLEPSWC